MSSRFLDDEARAGFARAIETIEAASSAEVVIALRRRSSAYRHANVIVGTLVAFLGLAAMLFAERRFSLRAILIDPFIVGVIAGALVELLPGVKRVLTPRAHRHDRVHAAARATFVERGVHATRERTGLLLYISWLEQDIVLVPDVAVRAALPPDALAAAEKALAVAMPSGGAAVAKVLEELSAELAKALPRRTGDVNELPNALDSDLRR